MLPVNNKPVTMWAFSNIRMEDKNSSSCPTKVTLGKIAQLFYGIFSGESPETRGLRGNLKQWFVISSNSVQWFTLWQYWLWSFQGKGTKLENFCINWMLN
jgi:hypothetical protein